jgi:hypothetical protein
MTKEDSNLIIIIRPDQTSSIVKLLQKLSRQQADSPFPGDSIKDEGKLRPHELFPSNLSQSYLILGPAGDRLYVLSHHPQQYPQLSDVDSLKQNIYAMLAI